MQLISADALGLLPLRVRNTDIWLTINPANVYFSSGE